MNDRRRPLAEQLVRFYRYKLVLRVFAGFSLWLVAAVLLFVVLGAGFPSLILAALFLCVIGAAATFVAGPRTGVPVAVAVLVASAPYLIWLLTICTGKDYCEYDFASWAGYAFLFWLLALLPAFVAGSLLAAALNRRWERDLASKKRAG